MGYGVLCSFSVGHLIAGVRRTERETMKILYSVGLQIRSYDALERLLNVNTFLEGELAFHNLYREVEASDFPIAQDCFGDQFLIRDNLVVKLNAETGDIDDLVVPGNSFWLGLTRNQLKDWAFQAIWS